MYIKFKVAEQNLEVIEAMNLASGSYGYIGAEFDFQTESWDEMEKRAYFIDEDDKYYDFPIEDNRIEPAADGLNLHAGIWKVYVIGNKYVDGVCVQRIPTNETSFSVTQSMIREGEERPPFAM